MAIPILVMVVMMPLSLYVTGDGDIRRGSGSTSVLWAVLSGLAASWLLLAAQRAFSVQQLTRVALKGAGELVPLALILLLALALGNVATRLGTGPFVARLTAGVLAPAAFLPLVFLLQWECSLVSGQQEKPSS